MNITRNIGKAIGFTVGKATRLTVNATTATVSGIASGFVTGCGIRPMVAKWTPTLGEKVCEYAGMATRSIADVPGSIANTVKTSIASVREGFSKGNGILTPAAVMPEDSDAIDISDFVEVAG